MKIAAYALALLLVACQKPETLHITASKLATAKIAALTTTAPTCAGACAGTAASCGDYASTTACQAQTGCSWSANGGCTGSRTTCESLAATSTYCANTNPAAAASPTNYGCYNTAETCTPLAGFACSNFSNVANAQTVCTNNDCSWDPASSGCVNETYGCSGYGTQGACPSPYCQWTTSGSGSCAPPTCSLTGSGAGETCSPSSGCSFSCTNSIACSGFSPGACPAGCTAGVCDGNTTCSDYSAIASFCPTSQGCALNGCGDDEKQTLSACTTLGCTGTTNYGCDQFEVSWAPSDPLPKAECESTWGANCNGTALPAADGECLGLPSCGGTVPCGCSDITDGTTCITGTGGKCYWTQYTCEGGASDYWLCQKCVGPESFTCAAGDGCAAGDTNCNYGCGGTTVACSTLAGCAQYSGCSPECTPDPDCTGLPYDDCAAPCVGTPPGGSCQNVACSVGDCPSPQCISSSTPQACVNNPGVDYNCSDFKGASCRAAAYCVDTPAACKTVTSGGLSCASLGQSDCTDEASLGCSWSNNPTCTGQAPSCTTYADANTCGAAAGCHWQCNDQPVLSAAQVTPTKAEAGTTFTFSVVYTDAAGNLPASNQPTLTINSGTQSATFVTAAAKTGGDPTAGITYNYALPLSSVGNPQTFCFDATDSTGVAAVEVCGNGPALVSGTDDLNNAFFRGGGCTNAQTRGEISLGAWLAALFFIRRVARRRK